MLTFLLSASSVPLCFMVEKYQENEQLQQFCLNDRCFEKCSWKGEQF